MILYGYHLGNKRNKVVDNLISLRKKYPNFVINSEKAIIIDER